MKPIVALGIYNRIHKLVRLEEFEVLQDAVVI